MTRRRLLTWMFTIGFAAVTWASAAAQDHPSRVIKLVVPAPPGGPGETVIRILADRLSSSLGQPVIVENLPGGAASTIGTRAVARAMPDGNTLLISLPGALVTAPAIYKNLGYNPSRDFAPIATIFSTPQLLVVNPALPVNSLRELVAYARTNPGKLNFPIPGYGTGPHLLGELFKQVTETDIVHVPYKDVGIVDLLAGRMQMAFQTLNLLLPHIQDGKLRALAVADEARTPHLRDVPTTTESGFPALQATTWLGVLAPAGTPAAVINRLNRTINELLRTEELKLNLSKLGATPKISSPQEFAAFIAAEQEKWTKVIKTANIKID